MRWLLGASALGPDEEAVISAVRRSAAAFRLVRINCRYPYLSTRAFRILRALGEERGLRYAVHADFGEMNLGALSPSIRTASLREARRALNYAARLGGGVVTFHPAPRTELAHWFPDEVRKVETASLATLSRYAEGSGVTVALENTCDPADGVPVFADGKDFSRLRSMIDEIGSSALGITLDTGHAHCSGVSLPETIRALGRYFVHVHAHDNDGRGDHHWPPGRGTIPWPAVLDALAAVGYQGGIELEMADLASQLVGKEYLERMLQPERNT